VVQGAEDARGDGVGERGGWRGGDRQRRAGQSGEGSNDPAERDHERPQGLEPEVGHGGTNGHHDRGEEPDDR